MKKYYYLIHIQYLGFRYHGWLKQPGMKTIESMIHKTLLFIKGHRNFKILGCSRTDSKVSANHSAFELFSNEKHDPDQLLKDLNINLPPDIKVLEVEQVDQGFSIINSPRIKEYQYLFSFGDKAHPFCAPIMSSFQDNLDIEEMKKGAACFKGRHNFIRYCTKPKPGTTFKREVLESEISVNQEYSASFFPEKSYIYHIHSKGFLRYQVRLIMGQLLCLGRGEISLNDLKESLTGKESQPLRHIAPASGLILNKIRFK